MPRAPQPPFALNFARAWGGTLGNADFRTVPDDFVVVETVAEEFSGDGEHLCLQIRKRDQNTRWVAAALAQHFGLAERDVGYCGMKDRRAVTTQWFSVRLPVVGNASEYTAHWPLPGCEVLQVTRNRRKLRRGGHATNAFTVTLRNCAGDHQALEQRLSTIGSNGVPNYFGEQRFGIDGGNLVAADKILRERNIDKRNDARLRGDNSSGRFHQNGGRNRGLYISAARAYLFNLVLSARVADETWTRPVDDEPLATGPLWGRGRVTGSRGLAAFEGAVLADYADWRYGLEHCGLQQTRRELTLRPRQLRWHWRASDLVLEFALPPGTFATSVLRELVETNVPARRAMV